MNFSIDCLNPFKAISNICGSNSFFGANLFMGFAGQILDKAIQNVGDKLGLPQSIIDMAQSTAHYSMGDIAGGLQNAGEAVEGVVANLNPFDASSIGQQIDDASSRLSGIMLSALKGEECQGVAEGQGEGKGDANWLVAIAKALGEMVGKRAANMQETLGKMEGINNREIPSSGEDKTEALQQQSQDFMEANSQFQAESQMFNIMAQTTSNVIKTLGQGISTIAQKN